MSGHAHNITDRVPSLLSPTVTEIFQMSDFPDPVGGVITLTEGTYRVMTTGLTTSDRFLIADGANVTLMWPGRSNLTFTYTGTGALFSSNDAGCGRLTLEGFVFVLSGNGASAFALTHSGGNTFIDRCTFSFTGTTGSIGFVRHISTNIINIGAVTFAGWTTGLNIKESTGCIFFGPLFSSKTGSTEPALLIEGPIDFGCQIDSTSFFLQSGQPGMDIKPLARGNNLLNFAKINGTTQFFKTGVTGTMTSAAASNTSGSVTSVTDGSPDAVFNDTAHGLSNGDIIIHTGFTESTYNGTFKVVSATTDTYKIQIFPAPNPFVNVAYVAGDTGSWARNYLVVGASTTTGISVGDQVTIKNSINYNGEYPILAVNAGVSFTIPATFVATENGPDFDTGSMNETSKWMQTINSGVQKDSQIIGSMIINGNTAATTITTQNTWTDLNLNANANAGSNIERWTLTNRTTGELRYDGINAVNCILTASITSASSGGAQEFEFRAVKNGSPLTDGVVSGREMGADAGNLSLVVPITVSPGDLIRLQVQNVDGTSNVIIKNLSVQIG